jgi:hypothetical protein
LANGPTQSYIYRAVSVTSSFKQGKFTQDLEGVLVQFPSTAIKQNDKPAEYNNYSSIPTGAGGFLGGYEDMASATDPAAPFGRNPNGTPISAKQGAYNARFPVVQPKNGAPALAPLNNAGTSAKPAKPGAPTSPAAKTAPPAATPLRNRPPTSGSQPVGVVTTPGGAATGIIRGRAAPVNTAPQRGAKDY